LFKKEIKKTLWVNSYLSYMKYFITENQQNKLKTKLLNSFEDIGVFKTLIRYSLSPRGLDVIFDGEFPDFTCYELYDLFSYFYFKNFYDKNFSYEFEGKTYTVLSSKRTDGVMEYDIEDPENNDGLVVLATPYYESECFLPVDVTDYFVGNDYYEVWSEDNSIAITPPEKFSSFVEFYNWFKEDGLYELFEFVIPLLEANRDKHENDDLY
jgi:hypothetical protein